MGDEALRILMWPTGTSRVGGENLDDEKWQPWLSSPRRLILWPLALTKNTQSSAKTLAIYGSLLVDCYDINTWMVEHHPGRQDPVLLARGLHLPQSTAVNGFHDTDQLNHWPETTTSQASQLLGINIPLLHSSAASSLLIPEDKNYTAKETPMIYLIISKPLSPLLSFLPLLSHL